MTTRKVSRAMNNFIKDITEGEILPGSVCEHCQKHRTALHDRSSALPMPEDCPDCLPASITALQRCTRCKMICYCVRAPLFPRVPQSKACQRADWPKHRAFCKALARTVPRLVGDLARAKSIAPWARANAISLDMAAASAVRFARTGGELMDYVFLVYLDVSAREGAHTHRVRDARGMPRAGPVVRALLDRLLEGGTDDDRALEARIAPKPGVILTLLVDTGACFPLNLVFWQGADMGEAAVHDDWLALFKEAVSSPLE
ncbi:hypothetical protein BV25DRAFT_1842140 [Artomyces pyxidatus]|uniref:Uncharacterized protein n=1 Tax=Artomyces pyxidatus TaxID=48021 RepID=A0ACB8SJN2_9AGAM|nr:hypothetical protein BV25DRAFT_1842140 [Artomyces pyxidatus]